MTQEKSIFDRLSKEMQKDIIIGGYLACFVAIAALFVWGIKNQGKADSCNERFTNFTIRLQEEASRRAEEKERRADSLRAAVSAEVESLKKAKAELEAKLKKIK